jgi:putative PIN family toxin of toxin-antitoxin system
VKVVFDANVLISALARGGTCDQAWRLAIERQRLFTSEPIVEDVRTKLIEKFRFSDEAADRMAGLVRRTSATVRPRRVRRDACRDVDDTVVLGTALAARADCIVSGDGDLLVLREFRGMPIITARAFLSIAGAQLEEE